MTTRVDNDTQLTDWSATLGATTLRVGTRPATDQFTWTTPASSDDVLQHGENRSLTDDELGTLRGEITDVTISDTSEFTAVDAMDKFNVDIAVLPFVGTLANWFDMLCGLVGYSYHSKTIPDRTVTFPGFSGDTAWAYLNDVLAMENLELQVSYDTTLPDVTFAVPKGTKTHITSWASQPTETVSKGNPALYVQVGYYNNTYFVDKVVTPWVQSCDNVISVDANESTSVTWELNAWLETVNQPTCVADTSISPTGGEWDGTNGAFAVCDKNNLPYPPAQWNAMGGILTLSIEDDDARRLVINVVGPNDPDYAPFRIAVADDQNYYSALRATATGVFFDEDYLWFRTGAAESATAELIGETVDNPLISTVQQALNVAQQVAQDYNGVGQTLSAESVNNARVLGEKFDYSDVMWRITEQDCATTGSTYDAVPGTTMQDMLDLYGDSATLQDVANDWPSSTLRDRALRPLRRVS